MVEPYRFTISFNVGINAPDGCILDKPKNKDEQLRVKNICDKFLKRIRESEKGFVLKSDMLRYLRINTREMDLIIDILRDSAEIEIGGMDVNGRLAIFYQLA